MAKIRLTESKLKQIVAESVKRVLKENFIPEYDTLMKFPSGFVKGKGRDWQNDFIKSKASVKFPDLDPEGFSFAGDELRHTGKKKSKHKNVSPIKREITPKPDNMSDEEYYNSIVLQQNEKIRAEAEKFEDEEWRPVVNGGRYFGGDAEYGKSYAVSNKGRLRILNYGDPNKSRIVNPYPAPTRNAMQFHLNFTDNGDDSKKTCPSVAYMVANAFLGVEDPKLYMIHHIDGDWKNNNVENLEWVPRKNKRDLR